MRLAPFLFAMLLGAPALPADAAPCGPADRKAAKAGSHRKGCEPARKFEPYEPARQRAGSRPGFIDLGNGTEIRVGGRVQLDYQGRP